MNLQLTRGAISEAVSKLQFRTQAFVDGDFVDAQRAETKRSNRSTISGGGGAVT
jgi:hypothetical protein